MPSIGIDLKPGRGWGAKCVGSLRSLSLGYICLWWIKDTITDELERNRMAIASATTALRGELSKTERIAKIVRQERD